MAINTQKLLPSAKTTSALARVNIGKIGPKIAIKKKTINVKSLSIVPRKEEPGEIIKILTDIDSRLKNILGEEQKQQNKKRKEKERSDFEKEEKKLEAPKEAKKFKLPSLAIPGASFLDRIKRFLFFTALGWLFTKFQDQLPKLLGIVKIITQVYGVIENTFKILLGSFVTFIEKGYEAYDRVRDLAKSIGGEKAQKEFDNLSSKLNEYINYALIGGMALTGAIDAFSKEVKGSKKQGSSTSLNKQGDGLYDKRKGKLGISEVRTIGGKNYRADRTTGSVRSSGDVLSNARIEKLKKAGTLTFDGKSATDMAYQQRKGEIDVIKKYADKFGRNAAVRRFGEEGVSSLGGKYARSGLTNFGRKGFVGVFGKGGAKAVLGTVRPFLKRIPLPVVGALIDFGLSVALGENPGRAAFRAIGAGILGAVGTAVGSVVPVAGNLIGGIAGGMLGDAAGGALYDMFFAGKKPQGAVQRKQGGGTVTRGGKAQGAPSRSLKIVRRRPPKVQPRQSQPGKDVGGKKKIRKLYPDPSVRTDIEGEQDNPWVNLFSIPALSKKPTPDEIKKRNEKIAERDAKLKKLPNPYKALTGVAKKLKDIPFGIGHLMGGAVDIALGQKLPRDAVNSLGDGISYLVSAIANRQIASSVSSIEKEVSKMQTGGVIPNLKDFTKQNDLELGKDISKILNGLIQKKVDEAIREVQKQMLPGKYDEQRIVPGETRPSTPPSRGPGSDPGGGPTPDGTNGRLPESSLKSVGQGECTGGCRLWKPAADAYLKMKADAAKEKIYFRLVSAYRTYEHQYELYEEYIKGRGNRAAPPGQSDHGWGKAIDLYPTSAQDWVRKNGRKYGWYWPPETGEAWHFVYVGGGRLEPQKKQTQLPKQQPQIPDVQNYGVKEGEQKRVKYNNENYIIARDKNKWRVYRVNPTTGLPEELDRTDKRFLKVLEQHRKTQSPTSPAPQKPQVQPRQPQKSPTQQQSNKTGTSIASWYGPDFYGNRSADGTILKRDSLWVAHKTLPFGTKVKFTYNGRTITVPVKDRGPFVSGREWDLTEAAAEQIGLKTGARSGTGSVQYEILGKQRGGYIPKQNPRRDTSSLKTYPSYAQGGRSLVIVEKVVKVPVPIPVRGGRSNYFAVAGVNNNSNNQSLSVG